MSFLELPAPLCHKYIQQECHVQAGTRPPTPHVTSSAAVSRSKNERFECTEKWARFLELISEQIYIARDITLRKTCRHGIDNIHESEVYKYLGVHRALWNTATLLTITIKAIVLMVLLSFDKILL